MFQSPFPEVIVSCLKHQSFNTDLLINFHVLFTYNLIWNIVSEFQNQRFSLWTISLIIQSNLILLFPPNYKVNSWTQILLKRINVLQIWLELLCFSDTFYFKENNTDFGRNRSRNKSKPALFLDQSKNLSMDEGGKR